MKDYLASDKCFLPFAALSSIQQAVVADSKATLKFNKQWLLNLQSLECEVELTIFSLLPAMLLGLQCDYNMQVVKSDKSFMKRLASIRGIAAAL